MNKEYFHPNISKLILSIYITFIFASYYCVYIADRMRNLVLFTACAAIVGYLIACFLLPLFAKLEKSILQPPAGKNYLQIFFTFTIITYLIMLVYYIAYYPGAWPWDATTQYWESINGNYDDWHPVWHTILAYTIPYKLTGNVLSTIVVHQIAFSLLIGYLATLLAKYCGIRAAMLASFYILFNPFNAKMVLFPWKDSLFSIVGAFCIGMCFELYAARNQIEKRIWYLLLLGFAIANASILRHNGVLLTIPLLIALFFIIHRKQWTMVIISFVITMFLIKGFLYSALNVTYPGDRVIASTGLPMTVIANVVKNCPSYDQLDSEIASFASKITTHEKWLEYTCGSFNSIKWDDGVNLEPIEEQGYTGMLSLTLRCFRYYPMDSLKALFSLTDQVYGLEPFVNQEEDVSVYVATNQNWGFHYDGNMNLRILLEQYNSITTSTFLRYARSYGTILFVMLCAMLATMKWNKRTGWQRFLLCIPVFTYDFGTMLLLTGPDSRFFFITFLVSPIVIAIAIFQKNEAST